MLAKLLKTGFSASRPIFRKALMSAFGAEWKWTRRQSSLLQSKMTLLGHEWTDFAAMHGMKF